MTRPHSSQSIPSAVTSSKHQRRRQSITRRKLSQEEEMARTFESTTSASLPLSPKRLLYGLLLLLALNSIAVAETEEDCLASQGDVSEGINAFFDLACNSGGLGCFRGASDAPCRLCKMFVTAKSLYYDDCPTPAPVSEETAEPESEEGGTPDPPALDPILPSPTDTPVKGPVSSTSGEASTGNPRVGCPQKLCRENTSGDCLDNRSFLCESSNSGTCPSGTTHCQHLLFWDDFNSKLDLKKWKHEITMAGGGNWEFQLYQNNRTNSFVRDGALHIRPTLTEDWLPGLGKLDMNGLTTASSCTSNAFYGCVRNDASPISSARLSTENSFTFTKGRVEVRAKLPRGDWLWPAIWMLPKHENYGMWPQSGEIDIMEGRGNAPGYRGNMGIDSVSSAIQWGMNYLENKFDETVGSKTLAQGDFADDYHVFGLVRHDDGLYTYVDDDSNRILEIDWTQQSFFERGEWDPQVWENPWEVGDDDIPNGTPFVNEEFFLIINLAVGGVSNFFPDDDVKPWTNDSPQAQWDFWSARDEWMQTWLDNDPQFKIDWVKVTSE